MNDSTLVLLKEKIIHTDSVIKLLSEKNGRIDQLREKLKFLYRKYLEKNKEVELCKLEHKPLTIDYKNLLEKFNALEEDYKNIVNKSEIKYQRICRELEESRNKSNEVNKCERCQEGMVKNRLLKKEIASLKQQVKRLSARNSDIDLDLKESKKDVTEIKNLKEHSLELKSIETKLKADINDYQNKLIALEAHELLLNEKIKELTLRLDSANQRLTKKVDREVTEGTLFHLLSECAVPELPNAVSKKVYKSLQTDTFNERQSLAETLDDSKCIFGKDIDDVEDRKSILNAEDLFPKPIASKVICTQDKQSQQYSVVDKGSAKSHQNNKCNIIKQVILATPKSEPALNGFSVESLHEVLPDIKVCSDSDFVGKNIQTENVETIKHEESETLYSENNVDIWKCIQEMKDYPQLLSPFSNYESDGTKLIDDPNDTDCKNKNNSLKVLNINSTLDAKRRTLRRRKILINGIKKDLFQSMVKYVNRLVCKGKRNSVSSKAAPKTKKSSRKFRSMRKVQMLRWKELRELWISNTDSEQDTSRTQFKKIRRRKYREKLEKEYLANKEHYGKLSANFHSITEFYNSLSGGESIKLNLNEKIVGCGTPDESCLSSLDSGFGRSDNENKLVNEAKIDEKGERVQKTKIEFSGETSEIDRKTLEIANIKSFSTQLNTNQLLTKCDGALKMVQRKEDYKSQESIFTIAEVVRGPIKMTGENNENLKDNVSNLNAEDTGGMSLEGQDVNEASTSKIVEGKGKEENYENTEKIVDVEQGQKCIEGNKYKQLTLNGGSISTTNEIVEKVEDNGQHIRHEECNEKLLVTENQQNKRKITAAVEIKQPTKKDKIFDNTGKLDGNEKQPTSVETNETISSQLNNCRSVIKVENKNEIDHERQDIMSPEKLFTAERQHEEGYKENCELTKDKNKTAEEVELLQIEEKEEPKFNLCSQETNQIVQRTTTQDVDKTLPNERRSKRCKNGKSKIKNLSTKSVENDIERRKSKPLTNEILGLIVEDEEYPKSHNLESLSGIAEESFVSPVKTKLRKAHSPKQCIDTIEKKSQPLSTISTRSKRKLKNNISKKCYDDDNNSEVEGNDYEGLELPAKKQKLENNQHANSIDIELIKCKIKTQLEAAKKTEKTTFKRPNRRKIQLESPASPPHVTECDDLPTVPAIIPLEPIGELHQGTAKRLLKKLIQFPDESTILQEVFEKFSDQKQEYVIRLILEEVASDISTPDTLYTPPAPVMTIVQRVLLGLLARLQETFPCIFKDILPAIEYWILTQATLQSIQPVTRFYIAVCKLQKVKHRMRRMVCDVFYSLEDLAVPFLFTVLGTWTDILPLEAESSDNPLVKVLIQVINMKTCTKPGYNLIPLKKLLEAYYGYPAERWNSEEVFKDIFENFKRTPTKYIEYCLLILFKNHPKKWVCQQISNHVKPVLGTTSKSNPIFSLLQNTLPMLNGDNSTYVQDLKLWLQELPL